MSLSLLSAQYGWAGKVRDICCLQVPAVYLAPLQI